MKEADMQLRDTMNQRDNETKILIASMNSQNQDDGIKEQEFSEEARANLLEKMREFDERLKLDRERLAFDKSKARTDAELKRKQINKPIVFQTIFYSFNAFFLHNCSSFFYLVLIYNLF